MKNFEILFNVSYLIIIWLFVIKMKRNQPNKMQKLYFYAFLFLAVGDTLHVGFRTVGHLIGNLDFTLVGIRMIGLGAFATAITVTITYLYFMLALHESYKSQNALKWISVLSIIRIVIVLLPQNNWFTESTYAWSLLRNIPLVAIGYFIVLAMFKSKDTYYKKFAVLIIWSYVFYLPVILFVNILPILGMLMIPKTVVYLLMLKLVYDKHFKTST